MYHEFGTQLVAVFLMQCRYARHHSTATVTDSFENTVRVHGGG